MSKGMRKIVLTAAACMLISVAYAQTSSFFGGLWGEEENAKQAGNIFVHYFAASLFFFSMRFISH